MSTVLKPLTHQKETIDNLNEQFSQNNNKALVVLPSGSGKTHTIAFHVAELKPKSFLYIVHRNEINTQTIDIFRDICRLNDKDIGIIDQNHKQFNRKYLFATIQTLFRDKNLDKINKKIEYMVIDEFHHAAADTYDKIMKYFKPKYFVGLTATPFRLDEKNLMDYVDNNVAINIDLFQGIERKILVPFHYIGLHDDIDYSKIKNNGFSYNVTDLDRKLIIHKRDEAVLKEYNEKIRPDKRLTIAFCNSISHVDRITSKFKLVGIKAAGITYKEDYEHRKSTIEAFRKGVYDILFTRDILNEGVDFPECSAIMFLRPTISKTLFLQQLGRGLRKNKGKKDVLVLDFIGNYTRAFEKRSWFLQAESAVYSGKYTKPLYEYNYPKPIVEFDSKVINILDIQEFGITKQDILEDYLNCCEKEGNIMLNSVQYENSIYKKYSIGILIRKFGKFSTFIIENDLTYPNGFERKFPTQFFKCKDKDLLIENYYNIKKNTIPKQGREKTVASSLINNPNYSKYGMYCYRNIWSRYTNFLKEIGEMDNFSYIRNESIQSRENKVKKAIKQLQDKLGTSYISSSDWQREYGSGLGRDFMKEYGGFKGFRKHFKIPDHFIRKCQYCNKEFKCLTMRSKNCCTYKCSMRLWYKTNSLPKKENMRKERETQTINCLSCNKLVKKYSGSNAKRFCSKYCSQRYRLKKQVNLKW